MVRCKLLLTPEQLVDFQKWANTSNVSLNANESYIQRFMVVRGISISNGEIQRDSPFKLVMDNPLKWSIYDEFSNKIDEFDGCLRDIKEHYNAKVKKASDGSYFFIF